jgi:type I restriction enzyme S subunit
VKAYKEYQRSLIPWIDLIPSHWEIKRAKTMYQKMNRPVEECDDVVTCFRDGMVTLRKNRRITGFTESIKEIGYQGINKGDLVIHVMDAFAGAIGVSDSNGKGTPVYSVCTAKGDYNNYYYAHLIREMAKRGFIQSLYRGIRERSSDFRYEVFGKQLLPIPPRAEQDQIVRYLDWKVSMINKYINAKKKQIELLKEEINYLTNVVISDTNKKQRFKVIISQIRNWINRNDGILYQPIGVLNRGRGIFHKENCLGIYLGNSEFFEIEDDVLMFSGQFAWEGAVAVTTPNEKGCIASHRYYTVRGNEKIAETAYLWAFFQTKAGDIMLNECSHGAAGRNKPLNFNELLNQYIPLPELSAQRKISNKVYIFLKVREHIRETELLLSEYRTRLISDAVTGRVNVQNIKVPEYETENLQENIVDATIEEEE